MSQLNVDNIRNRTGSNGGPNFPSGITVAVGQTAYIHGNLQVDGTETIINTETLNVSDKTVGIGSTSNASNTTADGSGIEIFASSSQTGNNKTLTWGNTANSWEFGPNDVGLKVGTGVTVYGGSGIVSATSFKGDVTGNLTGDVTGSGANLTNLPAGQLTGALPAISGANLTGIDAAPQVKLNASGAIAVGKPTIVNADGTVSEVKQTIEGLATPGYTSQANIDSPRNFPVAVQIPGTDRLLVAYSYAGNNNDGYAGIYERSGQTLTRVSSEAQFETGNTQNIGVVWDTNADRGVIFYVDNGDSDKFKAIICSVSGTTLTVHTGSRYTFPNGATSNIGPLDHKAIYDPDSQKIIVAFPNGGSSWNATAYVVTVDPSNNTLSLGSASTLYSSYSVRMVDLAYDTTNNKVVAAISADTSGNDGWVVSKVGTVSGTSITWGTEDDISTTQANYGCIVWMSEQQKLFSVYESDQSNRIYARVGTVSGTNVTWGAAAQCSSNDLNLIRAGAVINAAYDEYAKLPVVTWRAAYAGDSVGFVAARSISGTTVTYGNAVELSGGGGTRYPFVTTMNTSSGVPVMWHNTGGPVKYVFCTLAGATTNVTEENFIGFSAGSYTNGQEATIQITGNSNSNQSGLTPGQNYFVQNTGALGLTAASPRVYAGTAVSSTKIAVNKESAPAGGIDIIARWDFGANYGQNYFNHTGLDNTTYIKYRLEIAQMQFTDNNAKKVGLRVYDKDGTLRTDGVYRYNTQKKSFTTNTQQNESYSNNDKWLWVGTANNDRAYYDASIVWHSRPNPDHALAAPIMRADIYQAAWYSWSEACLMAIGATNWFSGFYIYNYTDSTNICRGKATLYGYKY